MPAAEVGDSPATLTKERGMSFLKSLFGGSEKDSKGEQGIEEHLDYLKSLRTPAIAMSASAEAKRSRIGGLPLLPDGVPWPEWKNKPLSFLCQIDLNEIPDACERHGLPDSGMLFFFYSQEQDTWGFDPKDEGSWRVVYATSPGSTPRAAPDGLDQAFVYMEKAVAFNHLETYPDGQDDRVGALNLSDRQSDQYVELCSGVFEDGPRHHLFGYPSPVQGNDMELECQLVSHGLYCGDPSGYRHQRAKELEAGRCDWVLLLQLDTDDDAGMMWGDCGMLYFWIRKDDLARGHFDKCWMILQCC
jgi:uncharacterized protein YwqG